MNPFDKRIGVKGSRTFLDGGLLDLYNTGGVSCRPNGFIHFGFFNPTSDEYHTANRSLMDSMWTFWILVFPVIQYGDAWDEVGYQRC